MKLSLALLLAVFSIPAYAKAEAAPITGTGIGLSQTLGGRKASLLGNVELAATYTPSATPALRLLDGIRFERSGAPLPLDTGSGLSSGDRPILALLLGLIVGFGTGHLIGRSDGFVLWLVVDIAIVAATVVLGAVLWLPYYGGLTGLALLVTHIIQGLDAYQKSGGERIVQMTRERSVPLASTGSGLDRPAVTTRAFALAF